MESIAETFGWGPKLPATERHQSHKARETHRATATSYPQAYMQLPAAWSRSGGAEAHCPSWRSRTPQLNNKGERWFFAWYIHSPDEAVVGTSKIRWSCDTEHQKQTWSWSCSNQEGCSINDAAGQHMNIKSWTQANSQEMNGCCESRTLMENVLKHP